MTDAAALRMTHLEAEKTPFRERAPSWMDASAMNVTGRRHGVTPAPRGLGAFAFLAIIALVVAAAGIVAVMVWGPDVSPRNRTPAVVTNATGPVSSAAGSSGQTAGSDPLPPSAEAPSETVESAPLAQPVPAKKAAKKAARPNAKRGH